MSRFRWMVIVGAIAALACAGVASAKTTRVKAGSLQFTLAAPSSAALTANHLTVAPAGAATESGSTVTFPINSGRVNATSQHGRVAYRGRLIFANGTRTFRLRRPVLNFKGTTANVYGWYAAKAQRSCVKAPTAARSHALRCTTRYPWHHDLLGVVDGITAGSSTLSGTFYPSTWMADEVNALAGAQVLSPSVALGTLSTTVS